jgi:hypothetical protein
MRKVSGQLALACAAVLLACPAARSASLCAKSPRKALAGLIKRAMKIEETSVLHGAPEKLLGWAAPVKGLDFGEAREESHVIEVIVRPGKNEHDLQPVSLLIIHMVRVKDKQSREMFSATLTGRLEGAGIFYDRELEEGSDHSDRGTELERLGPYNPRTVYLFQRELMELCDVAAGPSIEEQIVKLKTAQGASTKP